MDCTLNSSPKAFRLLVIIVCLVKLLFMLAVGRLRVFASIFGRTCVSEKYPLNFIPFCFYCGFDFKQVWSSSF